MEIIHNFEAILNAKETAIQQLTATCNNAYQKIHDLKIENNNLKQQISILQQKYQHLSLISLPSSSSMNFVVQSTEKLVNFIYL